MVIDGRIRDRAFLIVLRELTRKVLADPWGPVQGDLRAALASGAPVLPL